MARTPEIDNLFIADVLEQVALQLESQWAPPGRVEAFRNAAKTVRKQRKDVQALALKNDREHLAGVLRLGISEIAAIEEIAHTGRLRLLDRLEGRTSPAEVFAQISGVSKSLAVRIHNELLIDTLEDLEVAAHDGRLKELTDYSPRRLKMIQNALASTLRWSSRRDARRFHELARIGATIDEPPAEMPEPDVGVLLKIDAEYRDKVRQNCLTKLKPTGHNPEGMTWLPVLHTELDQWQFTAMFENSERAHGETGERVVIVFERQGIEGQRTVITGEHGRLSGRRLVAGCEEECMNLAQLRASVRPLRTRLHLRPN